MENMENDMVTLIDENGQETLFEIVVSFEVNDQAYAILTPADSDEETGIIFKIFEDGDEQTFEYLSDEDEFDFVAKAYEELMRDEYGDE